MDFSRVLQARELMRFCVLAALVGAGALAAAALILPAGRPPSRGAVVFACDSSVRDGAVREAVAGNAVIDGCRESQEAWVPPY